MPRLNRKIFPGVPHHVVQRGNRRQQTFFFDEDYITYMRLLSTSLSNYGVEIWAYCLMPNHVHLIAVPSDAYGLSRGMAEAHLTYARIVNNRNGWTGCLWQGRYKSFPMDEDYLAVAVRYVELNPVRAGLCNDPFAFRWSSARAHLLGENDGLVNVKPLLQRFPSWTEYLNFSGSNVYLETFLKHKSVGKPLGSKEFLLKWQNK